MLDLVTGDAAGSADAGCPETDAAVANPPINNQSYGIPERLGPELVGAWRTPTWRRTCWI